MSHSRISSVVFVLLGSGLIGGFVHHFRSTGAAQAASAPLAPSRPSAATPRSAAAVPPVAPILAAALRSAVAEAASTAGPPVAVEPPSETDEQRHARVAAQAQAQFETDAAPSAESWQMRRVVDNTLRAFSEHLTVRALECRQRLCRMELLFDSMGSDVQVLSDLFLHGKAPELLKFGGMIAPTREERPDGSVLTTVYLAREGDIETFE